MYPNLRAELARRGMTIKQLNKEMRKTEKIAESTLFHKMTGKSEFTLAEAMQIKGILDTGLPIEVLFNRGE